MRPAGVREVHPRYKTITAPLQTSGTLRRVTSHHTTWNGGKESPPNVHFDADALDLPE